MSQEEAAVPFGTPEASLEDTNAEVEEQAVAVPASTIPPAEQQVVPTGHETATSDAPAKEKKKPGRKSNKERKERELAGQVDSTFHVLNLLFAVVGHELIDTIVSAGAIC